MGDRVLLLGRQLGRCLGVTVGHKHHVVAEAASSPHLTDDRARHHAVHDVLHDLAATHWIHERNRAPELSTPAYVGNIAELGEQELVVGPIDVDAAAVGGSAPPGGEHPGHAV